MRGNVAFTQPTQTVGYYRGPSQYGGEGSGIGGTMGAGNAMQGASPANEQTGWHPTILYLFGLLVAEFIILGIVNKYL